MKQGDRVTLIDSSDHPDAYQGGRQGIILGEEMDYNLDPEGLPILLVDWDAFNGYLSSVTEEIEESLRLV
jgi:hypothetical protein